MHRSGDTIVRLRSPKVDVTPTNYLRRLPIKTDTKETTRNLDTKVTSDSKSSKNHERKLKNDTQPKAHLWRGAYGVL